MKKKTISMCISHKLKRSINTYNSIINDNVAICFHTKSKLCLYNSMTDQFRMKTTRKKKHSHTNWKPNYEALNSLYISRYFDSKKNWRRKIEMFQCLFRIQCSPFTTCLIWFFRWDFLEMKKILHFFYALSQSLSWALWF